MIQSASGNLSRNYNAATMSKSLVFHCIVHVARLLGLGNETSERIVIWNPIHLVHVSTYRYVPTCTDLYYAIVCTGTYYLRNVAKRYR